MKVAVREPKSAPAARILLLEKNPRSLPKGTTLEAPEKAFVRRTWREGLFRGRSGEVFQLLLENGASASSLILLGIGKPSRFDSDALRRAFGVLGRTLRREGERRKSSGDAVLPLDDPVVRRWMGETGWEAGARAAAEGFLLGGYRFDAWKSDPPPAGRPLRLVLDPGGLSRKDELAARRGVEIGEAAASGACLARDLANSPPNDLYPETLAREARRVARGTSIRCRVLGEGELEREKMGALLGVAQASARPPRLIVLEYRPRARKVKTVVWVGKAVTFDSGGISLKPSRGMEDMKFDMSGGAAVIGAIRAISALEPAVRVVGLVPAVENLIGGSALRPGDVLRSASGKTIEVINTDAEGRLILADALHYARRFEPDAVVDLATLTGAMVVALGKEATGLVSNRASLARRIVEAGAASGEPVWELPLLDGYFERIKSKVADVKNSGGRPGAALTAAAFLARFAEGLPWAHLDIAGTAWTGKTSGYQPEGATGVGVRLLVDFALSFQKTRG